MRFWRGVLHLWASTPELNGERRAYVYNQNRTTWEEVIESRLIHWEEYTLHFDDLTPDEQKVVLAWTMFIEYQLN